MNAQDQYNAWLAARVGKVTSSDMWRVMKKLKDGRPAKSRRDYMVRLIAEHLTGQPTEFFMSQPMQWGIETEPQARAAYEARFNTEVKADLGFVPHPKITNAGCSPDGYVGRAGMIEIKCPETRTHIDTMLGQEVDEDYIWQMQWQLACHPERKWCDFWSFDPRLPLGAQAFRRRFDRDNELIEKMEADVIWFLRDMSRFLEMIQDAGAHVLSEDVAATL